MTTLHKITEQEKALCADFFELVSIYEETMEPIETSLEDMCTEANLFALAQYARRTYVCQHYVLTDLHQFNMAAIQAAITPLHHTVRYYKEFVSMHAHKYNGFIRLSDRTYLEQHKITETADMLDVQLKILKDMFPNNGDEFDRNVAESQAQIDNLRKVVIVHTDPKTGYVHRGRSTNENDDYTEASSVGMHFYIANEGKKS